MAPRSDEVSIIGMGYVGLTTAVCLAGRGVRVAGVESDTRKLRSLRRGTPTIHEPRVAELLNHTKSIRFVGSVDQAPAPLTFICVGTPSQKDGSVDLKFVENAVRQVGRLLRKDSGYRTIVVKSTAVPGTTMGLVRHTLEVESGLRLGSFGLCYNPEFLREGNAVEDTFHPDKVVIGTPDRKSAGGLISLYSRFYGRRGPKVITTTPANAEMIKYASNSFLSMKVSYVNQIARLCSEVPGCDVRVVADALGLDARIGRRFLDAGLGFGGSCFGKDLRAIRRMAMGKGVPMPLVDATLEVNKDAAMAAVRGAQKELGSLEGRRVAVLGLAFKAGTDDMRDAVSLKLIPELMRSGASVIAYDPAAAANAHLLLPGVKLAKSVEECVSGSDCAIIVTEWDDFRRLKPSFFKKHMRSPFVFDGRRIYSPESFRKQGVGFAAVGLGSRIEGPPHR